MNTSCTQFNQTNNNENEMSDILGAINLVATASGVDPRFILAVIMQESGGCVRVPTSSWGVMNPGVMQDSNGTANCAGIDPCPKSTITRMISEGTAGTVTGDGLANCINAAGSAPLSANTTSEAYYIASRLYNSGSYSPGDDLGAPTAGTSCYVS
jgi:hypothetical protein